MSMRIPANEAGMIRVFAFTALVATPALAGPLQLALPLDCTLGETCFIQNYVDNDPGAGAADFTCGTLTYDAVGQLTALGIGLTLIFLIVYSMLFGYR